MALVRYIPTAEAAESIKPHFERIESKGHEVPNFLRVLAHSPGVLEGFIAMNGALNKASWIRSSASWPTSGRRRSTACGYCLSTTRRRAARPGSTSAR